MRKKPGFTMVEQAIVLVPEFRWQGPVILLNTSANIPTRLPLPTNVSLTMVGIKSPLLRRIIMTMQLKSR